jgi:hypothetical protein
MSAQIFFPRNHETEYNLKQASKHSMQLRSRPQRRNSLMNSPHIGVKSYPSEIYIGANDTVDARSPDSQVKNPFDEEAPYSPVIFAPNRRLESGATVHGGVTILSAKSLAIRQSAVHPVVHSYTSPIGKPGLLSLCRL